MSGFIREKETDEEALGFKKKKNCKQKSQLGRSPVMERTWFDIVLPCRLGSWSRMEMGGEGGRQNKRRDQTQVFEGRRDQHEG